MKALPLFSLFVFLIGCTFRTKTDKTMTNQAIDPSIPTMWDAFIAAHPEHAKKPVPEAWYFCDNEKDANECAALVEEGIKQATSTSLWWYEKNEATLPKVGDIYIITNWDGKASAIIQTTQVDQAPYSEIDSTYAQIEGEGDQSLAYWRKVHWDYYSREMAPFNEAPTADMIIVCEQFKTVWK